MAPQLYIFLVTIAIILGATKLFIYHQPAGRGLTGLILIITGLYTQTIEAIQPNTAQIIGFSGYVLIAIGIWLIVKEITGR